MMGMIWEVFIIVSKDDQYLKEIIDNNKNDQDLLQSLISEEDDELANI